MEKVFSFWEKSDKFTAAPALFSALTALFIVLLFSITYSKLPGKLPLFYSLPWGQHQLVAKEQFLLLPGVLLLIGLVNTLIASQLHPIQMVLKRTLTLSLILVNLIIFITAIKIIFVFI